MGKHWEKVNGFASKKIDQLLNENWKGGKTNTKSLGQKDIHKSI